jgi:hypothetical protein
MRNGSALLQVQFRCTSSNSLGKPRRRKTFGPKQSLAELPERPGVLFGGRIDLLATVKRVGHLFGRATTRPRANFRITVSQHQKRLARDAQGWRGSGARRFRFGGKKEAPGVCRGCGESIEIQSESACRCNQIISMKQRLPMKRTLEAHTRRVWYNRASAAPAASFFPTIHPGCANPRATDLNLMS